MIHDNTHDTQLLESAIEIGEEIIDKAKIDPCGIHWRTVSEISSNNDVIYSVNETIFSGVSGIVLFYIKLYKKTKDEKYLTLIHGGGDWLIDCSKRAPTHGFYSGRFGTIYTLGKIAELGDERYLHKAYELALDFKNILQVPITKFNLNTGLAGTLLGLLHLHQKKNEAWILNTIEEGLHYLIKASKSSGNGLYWDLEETNSSPLCSLPLGTSGIGFLFVQLAYYFNNPDYQLIADQCFRYEDAYLDTMADWPDFSKDLKISDTQDHKIAYLSGRYNALNRATYSYNWLHGIAGIGLARLHAIKLAPGIGYESKLELVATKLSDYMSTRPKFKNYTLATGLSGIALTVLELANSKIGYHDIDFISTIAKRSIEDKKINLSYQFGFNLNEEYEDESLFMGSAGIGYFYLELLDPLSETSILLPALSDTCRQPGNHRLDQYSQRLLCEIIVSSWFPYTSILLKKNKLFERMDLKINKLLNSFGEALARIIRHPDDEQIETCYNYELQKILFFNSIALNNYFFAFCRHFEMDINMSFLAKKTSRLVSTDLVLAPYVKLLKGNLSWVKQSEISASTELEGGEVNVIYLPNYQIEHVLDDAQYILLNSFTAARNFKSAYNDFVEMHDLSENSVEEIQVFFNEQVEYYLSIGVLNIEKNKTNSFWKIFNLLLGKI